MAWLGAWSYHTTGGIFHGILGKNDMELTSELVYHLPTTRIYAEKRLNISNLPSITLSSTNL